MIMLRRSLVEVVEWFMTWRLDGLGTQWRWAWYDGWGAHARWTSHDGHARSIFVGSVKENNGFGNWYKDSSDTREKCKCNIDLDFLSCFHNLLSST